MSKRIFIDGYNQLKETIEKIDKKQRIFVLFCGSKDAEGHSWCPDCVAAEKAIEKAIENSFPSNGIFVDCSVGQRSNWKDPQSAFRIDSQLRLRNIPTLIEWGTSKRLVENQLMDEEMIKILFEDD